MSSTELIRYDTMCRAVVALDAQQHHCFQYPESPGVYVFDRLGTTLYVGESKNLRHRLTHHPRGYLRRSVAVRCRILPCLNHKQVEKWLIEALRPTMNGVSEEKRKRLLHRPAKSQAQIDDEIGSIWRDLFGERTDPNDQIAASVAGEDNLFPETLQERYPRQPKRDDAERVYALRDALTEDDVQHNILRMRQGGRALLKHADALDAWNRNRHTAA
ncbi:MAG TPA: hypothetical protein VH024_17635 [Candidatus Angelobacter sp.]|jgi:hypothetical protein|nr:hypothetical protein [Candidatus Angelobacter sp.]